MSASMGPRPFGRGRSRAYSDLDGDSLASMGPRPFGRGRPKPPRRAQGRPSASMGPRPFGRGRLLSGTYAFSVLEASMGPRPFGRGRITMVRRARAPHKLQWGRDLSVAEGAFGAAAGAGGEGFNGAATFRSRKDRRQVRRHPHDLASMGPRPFGRGRMPVLRQAQERLPVASMGPRPFGRGRAAPGTGSSRAALRRFNGAATFRSRKGGRRLYAGAGSPRASMGPRPFGRGRSWPNSQRSPGAKASMGPRPFGRGRCRYRRAWPI